MRDSLIWVRIAFILPPILAAVVADAARAATPAGDDFFERKIRPILVERCHKCHGAQKQWSGLRLDSRAVALNGGDSGPAIVAGDPDDSELVRRITDSDEDARMPPSKEGKRLEPDQIAAFKEWIRDGARWPESASSDAESKAKLWREHWAFQPVKRVEPPEPKRALSVISAIDRFVDQKLDEAGLQPSPEADRRTLIRRATYDLTGLPPTPDEIAEFNNDASPDAYERLIDRLLASPRYGEQWGRFWLDIARFSDTKGYVYARENRFFVHSSLYRDWVISAFNNDLPYDEFVKLQLAADTAAPDKPEELAAMGFLTLGRRMLGVTPDVIEDRIDMVGRGLLGLTIGCARCHDHKFDPIPTADYYSLYGVFANCVERQVVLPRTDGDTPRGKTREAELAAVQKELADTLAKCREEASNRVRSRLVEYLQAQRHLEEYPDLGVISVAGKEELLPGVVRRWEAYLNEADKNHDPVFTVWNAFARLPADQFSSQAAEVAAQLTADANIINPRVAHVFATPPASADEVAERYAKLFAEVDAEWTKLNKDARIANSRAPSSLPEANDEALRQVLYGENSPCVVPAEPIVNTEYLWSLGTVEKIWKLQSKVDSFLQQHARSLPCAVVLTDRDHIVEPQVFRRGNPMNKGETVPRRFLGVIAGPDREPFKHGSGRLELAQAIVDPTNPLTARVWANRVWLHHFGAGLVTTPSDFGIRSAPPSYPELLDWLASEFIRHGWSTKWLHRTIMLSDTYRQSSLMPESETELANAQRRDPDNRLLWRMNERRLNFEQFRDTLLATSGELDTSMGGKGVDFLSKRRSVYALIDRQYLPSLFNVFDFASPEFHSSQRSETTTPQQALFALNSPFLADRSRKIAAQIQEEANTLEAQATRAYETVLRREPTPTEVSASKQFLEAAAADSGGNQIATASKAWSYGYGEIDPASGTPKAFHQLPHFTGIAWQGGKLWPDQKLGWAQLTAKGGHPGDDSRHAVIRRWTTNSPGTISIKSEINHQESTGDGIQCWIVSSRGGVVASGTVYNERKQMSVDSLSVEPGDAIDFVVDRGKNLDSDQYTWVETISQLGGATTTSTSSTGNPPANWNSERDFPQVRLLPLEQLVQLLLCSNELMFVD